MINFSFTSQNICPTHLIPVLSCGVMTSEHKSGL